MARDSIRSVRGMNDLLPPESDIWAYFEGTCLDHFRRYGYSEIRTPILESTDLFSRGIGEQTDIVEKEMYTFPDRKGRSLTMRPEGTASTVRSYIQHGLGKKEPVSRLFYSGPMFRYERMQTGRYRQFYQIGVEVFGIAEPTIEAEQMAMLWDLYTELGVSGMRLLVNSVGDSSDRPKYRQVLVDFFTPHSAALCADCQRRLEKNPLRILDCKVPSCGAIAADAPSILEHLGEASQQHWQGLLSALEALGVEHEVDATMVRGLDYYTGPVFELVAEGGELGTHNTLAAGGRYDGLVASLGGTEVPAAGFALGVERAILSLPSASVPPRTPVLFIASHGDSARLRALSLATTLRRRGHEVEAELRSVGMKAQFKRADRLAAQWVVAIGESELESGRATLRHMGSRVEREVVLDDIADFDFSTPKPTA